MSKKPALLCAVLMILAGTAVHAQSLPEFSRAPEYKSGKLPNGVDYIMVASSSLKGHADFALIQKGATDTDAARRALTTLPHFRETSPCDYLIGHGILPGSEGYVRRSGGAAIFDFRDVPVYSQALRDSTLLLICDLMETHPLSQTLVVCGDVDPASLGERLYMLSLSVPAREAAPAVPESSWKAKTRRSVSVAAAPEDGTVGISIIYSTPSTPRDGLGTTIPLVSRKYTTVMGIILSRRMRGAFAAAGLTYKDLEFITKTSLDDSEVRYGCRLHVSRDAVETAMRLTGCVLAEFDSFGATLEEFTAASSMVASFAAREKGNASPSNSEYVQRCIDAKLFGASLASDDDINAYLSQQVLAPETEMALFNRYATALLDRTAGLAVSFAAPAAAYDPSAAMAAFDEGWQAATDGSGEQILWHPASGLSTGKAAYRKVKRKSITPEPLTSGETWIYSNGMRIVFKKTSAHGLVRFAFLLNGGTGSIQGLSATDAALAEEAIHLYNIGGISLAEARDVLACKGVNIDVTLSPSALCISGAAPTAQLGSVFDFLECFAQSRSLGKDVRESNPSLYQKLDKYLDRQFLKCADGAVILIGDLDRIDTEDLLKERLGAFTCQKQFAVRPTYTRSFPHTWRTVTQTGTGRQEVSLHFEAPLPYSQESVAAAGIASILLEQRLDAALAGLGMRAQCRLESDILPIEMASLDIIVTQVALEGLPIESRRGAPEEGLVAARRAVASLRAVSDSEFNQARRAYLDRVLSNAGRDEFLLQASVFRNTHGRDMVSGMSSRIEALDKSEVEKLITSLCGSTRTEVISK